MFKTQDLLKNGKKSASRTDLQTGIRVTAGRMWFVFVFNVFAL